MTYAGGAGLNLTSGETYDILDKTSNKLKVADDSGTCVWVDDCFFH